MKPGLCCGTLVDWLPGYHTRVARVGYHTRVARAGYHSRVACVGYHKSVVFDETWLMLWNSSGLVTAEKHVREAGFTKTC